MTKSTSIITNPSPQTVLTPSEREFSQTFIRDFHSPHARQEKGEDWKTYYHAIPDQFVKHHLNGKFWLGTKACWYPQAYNLDVDSPTRAVVQQIESTFEKYGIHESQLLRVTSPSYKTTGNFRIYFRLQYNEKFPTFALGNKVLNRVFSNVEIYPQKRRKDRLPFGKHSHIIADDILLKNLTWEQQLHFFNKLDAIDLDVFPRIATLTNPSQPTAAPLTLTGDAAKLLQNGLEKLGTRYEAQYQILNYLWRNNWLPGDASREVKSWIRFKHNGLSDKVNLGAWRTINSEIDRQKDSIWARAELSDTPNNLTNQITHADLIEAALLFPSDAVRQKQFINLVSYYRPRRHHDFVFISYRIWTEEIACRKTYKSFINDLKKRRILESVDSYQAGKFSRKFRLELPNSRAVIQQDNRNVTNYYEALRVAFNNNPRTIAEAMKIDRTTIWRHLLKEPALSLLQNGEPTNC